MVIELRKVIQAKKHNCFPRNILKQHCTVCTALVILINNVSLPGNRNAILKVGLPVA